MRWNTCIRDFLPHWPSRLLSSDEPAAETAASETRSRWTAAAEDLSRLLEYPLDRRIAEKRSTKSLNANFWLLYTPIQRYPDLHVSWHTGNSRAERQWEREKSSGSGYDFSLQAEVVLSLSVSRTRVIGAETLVSRKIFICRLFRLWWGEYDDEVFI